MNPLVEFQKQGSVGVITLNNPPVNALTVNKGLLQGVLDLLREGDHDPQIRAVVLIGGGRNFSGGADISEFGKSYDPDKAKLPDVLAYMDTMSKPIVAAISGPTMGGGLELALGCNYRVAANGAQIALPEVKLGILPGAGGTQRSPRLMGVEKAIDFMVNGDPISTEQARDAGLVDEIVTGELRAAAVSFANRVVREAHGPRRVSQMSPRIDGDANAFFAAARERVAKSWRGYPAPLAIVACVEAALTLPFSKGIAFERQEFEKLVKSDESRSLRHLFFAEREAARIPDVPSDTAMREIRSAAVIGAGTMGGGIAMNFANAGIPVSVLETKQEALDRGLDIIRKNYAATVAKGRLAQEAMDQRMALLRPTLTYESLAQADIVVEAVFEEMEVKKQVFAKLDAVAKPGAILATNTSTLDVNEIAAATGRPDQVVGMHFFSPANVMKLLEVVRGSRTAKDVLATTMKLGKTLRKVPVCVGVCDGFVGNRMLHKYFREAGYLLEEGATPWQVDRALEAFGFAMGPFRVGDLAGLDIGWAIRKRQATTRDPKERYCRIPDLVCEMGRFGQKTGAGYYKYEAGRKAVPDPAIEALIVKASADKGIVRRAISDQEIVERCMYQLVNEGAIVLEEGIAQRASDIDVVYAFGYGFPRFRGGPMFYADTVGLDKVLASVKSYHATQGDGWKPAPLLERLASEGGRFNR
ncbi:MAG: 3-hydroxyacyl-CoA dehydrogenase NAD-binding domain-containing protein [Burkholderiales bacterium]